MTETEIIKILSIWVDERKYPFQVPNAFFYGWECDYWVCDTCGMTKEFEIKISRQDFLKDAKKKKHLTNSGSNFFYYVCPKDLIKPDEIDKRYGLIYLVHGLIQIVKKPKRLHNEKFTSWKILANKMYWRYRNLWREKYISKEITRDEYIMGFNIELEKEEY